MRFNDFSCKMLQRFTDLPCEAFLKCYGQMEPSYVSIFVMVVSSKGTGTVIGHSFLVLFIAGNTKSYQIIEVRSL